MANNVNIFDKYGIKEVANVYFEALDDDLKTGVYKGDIVLFLDTLKVSTIEQTAENVAAQGGWGNPRLVQWDYGKEINITLEDALMSLESLRFMMGGAIKKSSANSKVLVRRTAEVVVDNQNKVPAPVIGGVTFHPVPSAAHPIKLINLGGGSDPTTHEPSECAGCRTQLTEGQAMAAANTILFKNPAAGLDSAGVSPVYGDHIRIFWEEEVATEDAAVEVIISPDTFPGTYRVVGDTYMRSEKTGKDEPFQFVINKAKVQSNVTLTLQAEGDPTTFEMTLNVLRSTNDSGENEMMKLVRYSIEEEATSGNGNDQGSLNAGS